jgi:hypothetical protein
MATPSALATLRVNVETVVSRFETNRVLCNTIGGAKRREWVVFRKHTRVRLGERRRAAKLTCQRILEEMHCERQQREAHSVDVVSQDEDEATLH